ncbi:MAG: class I tRNA ligase family protein, partial [Actinobacteria bacterium]|nr:class I tRNA ligase family protein [Actinomycetota bacterium]
EIIEKSGADALRYTLASLTTPGKNLLLGEEKIEGSRNFANKLWNASKFVISGLENSEFLKTPEIIKNLEPDSLSLNLWDRWILSRFAGAIKSVNNYLEKYSFSFACRMLTDFFWNDFCDWYIESAKVRLYSKNNGTDLFLKEKENKVQSNKTPSRTKSAGDGVAAVYVLWHILEQYLRLLHPFMPFITEKIWQSIPHNGCSIMIGPYPVVKDVLPGRLDLDAEAKIGKICSIIGEIRKIRSELKINPALRIEAYIKPSSPVVEKLMEENSSYIIELARLDKLSLFEPPDKKGFISSVKNNSEIYIFLEDVIDLRSELERINNEIAKINTDRKKSYKKLTNPQFLEKAPKKIIQKEETKLKQADKSLKVLNEQLEKIKSII